MIDVRITKIEDEDDSLCQSCDINTHATAVVSVITEHSRQRDTARLKTRDTSNHRLCTDCVLRMHALFDVSVDSFMEAHGRRKRS